MVYSLSVSCVVLHQQHWRHLETCQKFRNSGSTQDLQSLHFNETPSDSSVQESLRNLALESRLYIITSKVSRFRGEKSLCLDISKFLTEDITF